MNTNRSAKMHMIQDDDSSDEEEEDEDEGDVATAKMGLRGSLLGGSEHKCVGHCARGRLACRNSKVAIKTATLCTRCVCYVLLCLASEVRIMASKSKRPC